jgi:hypothetical protein
MVDSFTGAFSKIAAGSMIGVNYKEIQQRKRLRKSLWD